MKNSLIKLTVVLGIMTQGMLRLGFSMEIPQLPDELLFKVGSFLPSTDKETFLNFSTANYHFRNLAFDAFRESGSSVDLRQLSNEQLTSFFIGNDLRKKTLEVDIAATQLNEAFLSLLPKPLKGMTAQIGEGMSIAGLKRFLNLSCLRLWQSSSRPEPTDISSLSELSNLKVLSLQSISAESFTPLSALTHLRSFAILLTNEGLDLPSLEPLSRLPNLTSLRLWSTKITPSNLEIISNLKNIKDLFLSSTQLGNIEPLSQMTNLRTLSLDNNKFTSLKALSQLINLRELRIEGIGQDVDLAVLSDLANLKNLHLGGALPKLESLSLLTQLESLSIWNTKEVNLFDLASLTQLKELDLSSIQEKVSNIELLSNFKSLKKLGISKISDLSPLAGLKSLTSLDLSGSSVRDLSPLVELTNLTLINLRDTPLSVQQIESFKAFTPGCRVLY